VRKLEAAVGLMETITPAQRKRGMDAST